MIRWWERRTLRVRLAAWYALGGVTLVALFSATLYLYVSERLARPLDHELRRDLSIIQQRLTVNRAGNAAWDGRELPERVAWPTQNPWFELWDDQGVLVKRVWPFTDNRVQTMPMAPARGRETISVFNVAQDLRLRVLSVPFAVPGEGDDWMIRVMRVHEPAGDALRALRIIIFATLPIVVALLVLGGYVLTRRWLQPLDQMVSQANLINAEAFDRRLPVANEHDELGRLATVFNVTLDRLEQSYAALNRFVADASHELRTPLTTLRSVGEIGLRRGRTVEEYRDIIGSMLEEAQRLQLLVQRLLELATAEGGAAEPQPTRVVLDEFVRNCVTELSILAETKGQQVTVEGESCVANTDPVLLRQALQNLLDNAIKYSPANTSIRVRVWTENGLAHIAVADDGPGINPEHRTGLTARFFRPDRGRDRDRGGFGLGLSITKAYMSVLGGTLTFRPGSPRGSVFTLTIPGASRNSSVPDQPVLA